MKKLIALIVLLVSTVPAPLYADAGRHPRGDRQVTVMTRNIYLGASLARPVAARSLAELVTAVTTTFAIVLATDFQE